MPERQSLAKPKAVSQHNRAGSKLDVKQSGNGTLGVHAEQLASCLVAASDLKLDEKNFRTHDKRSIAAIASSLNRFGQLKPIVVDQHGIVIAGNGTLQAARSLGWSHVAAVRANLSEHDRKAFAVADNRSAELSEWNEQSLCELLASMDSESRDLLGFSMADMEKFFGEKSLDLQEATESCPSTPPRCS
jgi:hypothetical protein